MVEGVEVRGWAKILSRRVLSLSVVISLVTCLWPAIATAQSNELKALTEQYLQLYRSGAYDETIAVAERAVRLAEQESMPDSMPVGIALNNLAEFYRTQGRYNEAIPLYTRVLTIFERNLGPEHPDFANALNNFGLLYQAQWRYDDAEKFLRRALAIKEKSLASDDPDLAVSLNNLAELYRDQGRDGESEPLYLRALTIREKALGPDHPEFADALNNLALHYSARKNFGAAESLLKRALAIKEKSLGSAHPDFANLLNNIAEFYRSLGRFDESEPVHLRALAIFRQALGAEHPKVAMSLSNLALLHWESMRLDEALAYIRQVSDILRTRATVVARDGAARSNPESEYGKGKVKFRLHTDIALTIARRRSGSDRQGLVDEAFEAAQLGQASAAARSLAHAAARSAAGTDALAQLVRERQDASDLLIRLDHVLIGAVSLPPDQRDMVQEAKFRQAATATQQRLKSVDGELARDFPEFAELSSPQPVKIAKIQRLLVADEALLLYTQTLKGDGVHLFVLRTDRANARTLPIRSDALANTITELRRGVAAAAGNLPYFDTELAYQLYEGLVAPAMPLLDGVRHLIIVPNGPLASLPFAALVTGPHSAPRDLADYRNIPWLARSHTLSVLPAVSSLQALRAFAKPIRAVRPFVGYGDPLIGDAAEAGSGEVRKLRRLPDTAGELRAIAGALGADAGAVRLGAEASEAKVKVADLSNYRVVAFATHGLVPGEIKGLSEPALVLTPPRGSEDDDGLLTASEIAQLKLDAEWVVLSACNTAVSDNADAEGLSALAKSFFYAGARALLLSQWAVESTSAVRLTTTAFGASVAEPGIGRAEALRRAMLALMDDLANPAYAHPAFWAPFVVVGEGGARPAR